MNIHTGSEQKSAPAEKFPNPPRDAERMFSGDIDTIEERMRRNSYLLIGRAYDRIAGPSFSSFREIFDQLSEASVNDLRAFRMHLWPLVMSGLSRQQEIFDKARSAWHEAKGTQDQGLIRQTTPYLQFVRFAGNETAADKQNLASSIPSMTFRRFSSEEMRGYALEEPERAASANALIFNVLFHPDHTFRDKADIETLVRYLESELDLMIHKAQERA